LPFFCFGQHINIKGLKERDKTRIMKEGNRDRMKENIKIYGRISWALDETMQDNTQNQNFME
jgi:hypothetical protein